jgi:hypothetical protein
MVALLKMPKRNTADWSAPYTPYANAGAATAPFTTARAADSITLKGAERRVFPRKEFSAQVEGRRLDNSLPARQQPHLTLALRDLSLGGLSAISPTPLQSGERLTVFFPEHGPMRGWDAYGRVLRCEASGLGYRVAVEFDPLPAA